MSHVDLDAIRKRVERAHEEVCGLCDGSRKWTMRIPAQPERDSDLVISAALAEVEALLAEVDRLRADRDEAEERGWHRGFDHARRYLGASSDVVAAALAYVNVPDGTDEVEQCWWELKNAVGNYERATGGDSTDG